MHLSTSFSYAVVHVALIMGVITHSAAAQTIYNVPSDTPPNDLLGSDVINLNDGGSINFGIDLFDNSEMNVFGGELIGSLDAADNSSLNLFGGRIFPAIRLIQNSSLLLAGGAAGATLEVSSTASATIQGGEFRLDGVLIPGLENLGDTSTFVVPVDKTFSGVLSDGSVFSYRGEDGDVFNNTIQLERTTLPTLNPVVNVPSDPVPPGVRGGETLNVNSGGTLPYYYAAGVDSVVNVDGGEVGSHFEAIGAEINVSSGIIRRDPDLFLDSTLNISGGFVGDSGAPGQVFDSSMVTVTGGNVGWLEYLDQSSLHASGGDLHIASLRDNATGTFEGGVNVDQLGIGNQAAATISGGTFGEVSVQDNATLDISGGLLGEVRTSESGQVTVSGGHLTGGLSAISSPAFEFTGGKLGGQVETRAGSTLEFHGSDFRLDGVLISNLDNLGDSVDVVVPQASVLSGVLSDGEMFALDGRFDRLEGTIRLTRETTVPVTNTLIEVPTDPAPSTIRAGQTLILRDGGELPRDFGAHVGSTLQIEGGTVGFRMEAVDADIVMSGGMVDEQAHLYAGSSLDLTGGRILSVFTQQDSHMTVNGGEIHSFDAHDHSTVHILSGEIGATADLHDNSVLNVSGGTIDRLELFDTATAQLTGDFIANQLATNGESHADISGGTIARIRPRQNSSILFTGGTATEYVEVSGTATATISNEAQFERLVTTGSASVLMTGGVANRHSYLEGNSTVSLEGGHIGSRVFASGSATVDYSGGSFGEFIDFRNDSELNIFGGEFYLDGVPVAGLDTIGQTTDIILPDGAVLVGTAADGTVFAFSSSDDDTFQTAITLTSTSLPAAGDLQGGIRPGQIVSLGPGESIPSNRGASIGSQLTANGVSVGDNFEVVGATIDIMNSEVGDGIDAHLNSTVTILDSTVGSGLQAFDTSHVSVTGGELGQGAMARDQSVVDLNTTSGIIFSAYDSSTVNVTGGNMQGNLAISDQARLNITGGSHSGFNAQDDAVVMIEGGNILHSFSLRDNAIGYFQGQDTTAQRAWTLGDAKLYVSEGFVGPDGLIEGDSIVEMTGGRFGAELLIQRSGKLNMSGGGLGREVTTEEDGKLVLYGDDFQLDGVPVSALSSTGPTPVDVPEGSLFSGTLADGTPIAFYTGSRLPDRFVSGSLQVQLSPITTGPTNISVTTSDAPVGIRAGQTMVVGPGGVVPDDFQAGAGSVLEVNEGQVGDFVDVVGATVKLEAGSIGTFDAYLDSKIYINGGTVRSDNVFSFDPIIWARHDTMISVNGGFVEGGIDLYDRASLEVNDGEIQDLIHLNGNHTATFFGGKIDRLFVENSSQILIDGGELGRSSRVYGESRIDFVSGRIGDNFGAYSETTFVMHDGELGEGFGASGIIHILGGAIGKNATISETGMLTVEGGNFADGLEVRSLAHLSGGNFEGVSASFDANIDITGAAFIRSLDAKNGSTVTMSGGTIDESVNLSDRATLNLWGGEINSSISLIENSTLNLHSGSFNDSLFALNGSSINLFGSEFYLDGSPISDLNGFGDSSVINERDGALLTGVLEDGSWFALRLNSRFMFDSSYIEPDATVSIVYAVPEPSSVVLITIGFSVLLGASQRIKRKKARYGELMGR